MDGRQVAAVSELVPSALRHRGTGVKHRFDVHTIINWAGNPLAGGKKTMDKFADRSSLPPIHLGPGVPMPLSEPSATSARFSRIHLCRGAVAITGSQILDGFLRNCEQVSREVGVPLECQSCLTKTKVCEMYDIANRYTPIRLGIVSNDPFVASIFGKLVIPHASNQAPAGAARTKQYKLDFYIPESKRSVMEEDDVIIRITTQGNASLMVAALTTKN